MKILNYFFVLLFLVSNNSGKAQIGINTTGNDPHSSAALDIDFSDKGLLIPRVALSQTTSASPITSPATSLLVYNTEFFQVVHQERQILQRHG